MADMKPTDPKTYYNRRKSALKLELETFISHYKELAEFIKPRRGRFLITDRNKGDKRYGSIINSKATQALRVATSGMLAGTMSPTRPWFSLETHDPDMMEHQPVKEWLFRVERLMRQILASSNFYGQASTLLGELLLFGTGAMSHVDDYDDVARFYTHTAGSYMISQNDRFEVDTMIREFEWTVKQIVDKFGLENVSAFTKGAYDRGNYETWVPVCHIIEPNKQYDHRSKLAKNKKFASVYWEPGSENRTADMDKLLSISGYDEFPVYVPRWDVTGEDIYGTDCPGMIALGDVKGLQVEEKRKAQGIDKLVNPPLHGPAGIRGVPIESLPGGSTLYDATGDFHLKPLYEVRLPLQELRLDIDAVERRIGEAFFVDLFFAISQMEGIQPRNQLDIMQRNEERLLQLGPVLEHIQSEFADPLINRTFNQCVRAGILPPAPEELAGSELRVKYISTLAMAQRAVATQSIDRLAAFTGNLLQLGFQGAGKKFDANQAIDEYAQAIGSPPSLVVPDDVVQQQEAAESQKQELADTLAMGQQAANAAKMASDAKTGDKNVLTDLTGAQ